MRRVAALALGLMLALAQAAAAAAQASEHERLGVETAARHRLEAGIGFAWSASEKAWVGDGEATLDYSRDMALGFGLRMPASISYSRAEPGERWEYRWGDPLVSVSYLWRGGRYRIGTGLGYSFPIAKAAGYHRFSPSLSLALVRDPVILAWSARLSAGLPREGSGYLLYPALSGSLGLSFWELLNDRISYRVGVEPGFSLGILRLGLDDDPEPRWHIGLSLTVSWDERSWGVQAGWIGGGGSSVVDGKVEARGSLRREW